MDFIPTVEIIENVLISVEDMNDYLYHQNTWDDQQKMDIRENTKDDKPRSWEMKEETDAESRNYTGQSLQC